MIEVGRDELLTDIDEQTVLDVDTLAPLDDDALRVLLSAVDRADPDAEDADTPANADSVTGAAAGTGERTSELLAESTVRRVVEGDADADAFDRETLRASIQRVYGDTVDDYSIGIEGKYGSDTSPSNPQEALARVSSDALGAGTGEDADDHAAGVSADATGSDLSARASTDDGSADPSDYSAGTEGDA